MPLCLAADSLGIKLMKTGRQLLSGVTFDCDLQAGVALVGRSGSGKTLLCRALTGLVPQGLECSGIVRYPSESGALGAVMVPQHAHASLPPGQSALKLVADVARHRGTGGSRSPLDAAHEQLLRVGLPEDAIRLRPHQLSGGMARRVALAAALTAAAVWVILDEPTVGLDSVAKQSLIATLFSIKNAGTGLLIATHDAVFARALCDQAIVLEDGRCSGFGEMRQVLASREGDELLSLRPAVLEKLDSGGKA